MAEYINRDELIENLNKFAPEHYSALINQLITKQPTADVVEVVRCKVCKDYVPVMYKGEPMHYGFCLNTHDDALGNRHRYEGDYCSYGERKDT